MADPFVYHLHNQPENDSIDSEQDDETISFPPNVVSLHPRHPEGQADEPLPEVAEGGLSLVEEDTASATFMMPPGVNVTVPGPNNVRGTVVVQESLPRIEGPSRQVGNPELPPEQGALGPHPDWRRPLSPCNPVPLGMESADNRVPHPVHLTPPIPEVFPRGDQETVPSGVPYDRHRYVFSTRTVTDSVQRLHATFRNWPKERIVKSRKLAAAGFMYTGLGDTVKCVVCGGELSQWEEGDDPKTQHQLLGTECTFP